MPNREKRRNESSKESKGQMLGIPSRRFPVLFGVLSGLFAVGLIVAWQLSDMKQSDQQRMAYRLIAFIFAALTLAFFFLARRCRK